MDKVKYLILDFGDVLAYPVTGSYFITPNFWKIVDKNEIDIEQLKNAFEICGEFLDDIVKTELEEFELFKRFYINVFKYCKYEISEEDIEKIAKAITYDDSKYEMYSNTKQELEDLSKKYKLILLSDNWPCGLRIMKNWGIDKYFEKLYISSVYGEQKKDGTFFDYPIKEFNIKNGEAIFVDDKAKLLKVAKTKNLIPVLMDRKNTQISNEFKIINNLKQIENLGECLNV